jgi:hypothetical protein
LEEIQDARKEKEIEAGTHMKETRVHARKRLVRQKRTEIADEWM